MKRALILHGTGASSGSNWFPWLKEELERRGLNVWIPDLPESNTPNISRYNQFLLSHDFVLDQQTFVVGHSSGAVAALGLAQTLDRPIGAIVAVSAFRDDLGWDSLKHLFEPPLDMEKIRRCAEKIIFVHAKDDPHCPVDGAYWLASNLSAESELLDTGGHFSYELDPRWRQFPELIDILNKHHLL